MTASPRVLVLDQSADTCRLLDVILSSEGYVVDSAPDTTRFLERLRAYRADLVIYEPGSGYHSGEALLALLALLDAGPIHRGVPVLICTAADPPVSLLSTAAFRRPATAILTKPFQLEDLLAAVHGLCSPRT